MKLHVLIKRRRLDGVQEFRQWLRIFLCLLLFLLADLDVCDFRLGALELTSFELGHMSQGFSFSSRSMQFYSMVQIYKIHEEIQNTFFAFLNLVQQLNLFIVSTSEKWRNFTSVQYIDFVTAFDRGKVVYRFHQSHTCYIINSLISELNFSSFRRKIFFIYSFHLFFNAISNRVASWGASVVSHLS